MGISLGCLTSITVLRTGVEIFHTALLINSRSSQCEVALSSICLFSTGEIKFYKKNKHILSG